MATLYYDVPEKTIDVVSQQRYTMMYR